MRVCGLGMDTLTFRVFGWLAYIEAYSNWFQADLVQLVYLKSAVSRFVRAVVRKGLHTELADSPQRMKGLYWEPQEYSRNTIGMCLPGSLYSIFLLYSWGSLFRVIGSQ